MTPADRASRLSLIGAPMDVHICQIDPKISISPFYIGKVKIVGVSSCRSLGINRKLLLGFLIYG
jgi:hypothetical protein